MCIWPVSKLVAVPVCWFPREVGSVCDKCTEGRVLLQYASNSSSPRPCAPSGHWSPREAEGTVLYTILTGWLWTSLNQFLEYNELFILKGNFNIKTKPHPPFIHSVQYDNMIWGLPFVDFLSQYSNMQTILVTDSTSKHANDSLDSWHLGRGTTWKDQGGRFPMDGAVWYHNSHMRA